MTTSAAPPADVREATRRHLAALDAAAPGLVASLYLTGSAALGDYQPGRSDIDFMGFTTRPVTEPDVVALLAGVHASLPRSATKYDGSYVAQTALFGVPDDEPPAPHVVNGEFRGTEPNHALTPATWTEFNRYGIAVRGPRAASLGIEIPRDRLSRWTLGNLNGYWRRRSTEGLEHGRTLETGAPVAGELVAWDALGAARLHYTLATGDIASKSAAGRYAMDLFPAYTDVVSAALAWRATGDGEFTVADWCRCAQQTLDIIADANRRWG
ncbi:MAG TPA: nucleotidyltransferase domain-containing protein [Streptosporangiaceae bacterium]